jgi:hypothetical protein
MSRRYGLFLGGAAAIFVTCEAWVHVSAAGAACAGTEVPTKGGVSLGQLPLLEVGSLFLVVWVLRAVWLAVRSDLALRAPPRLPDPPALVAATQRTGVRQVVCLDSAVSQAFCAGAVRPHIFVTPNLIVRLSTSELEAVLLHEEQHRRSRDPLHYVVRRAAADVCFFLPLVAWWADHAGQSAELRADRAVLARVGPSPLAGALLAATSNPSWDSSPSFQGAAELRAAQLLGDRIPRRSPTPRLVGGSLLGMGLLFQLAWCVTVVQVVLEHSVA